MKISFPRRIRNLIAYLRAFVLLIFVFCAFSFISSLLPDKPVRKNIERSVTFMEGINEYPEPILSGKKHRLDYYMDGLIMNMIYSVDNQDVFKSAMFGRSRQLEGQNFSQLDHLKYSIANNTLRPNVEYARYWHGNTFFFRFFFLFTEFNELKWIIYLITSILLVAFTINLYRYTGGLKTLGMTAGLFIVNIYLMQFSMQLSPVLIISIIACLVLIQKFRKKPDAVPMVFFFTGAIVSYFDLLTAPLLTLGLPMLLWVSLDSEQNDHTYLYSLKKLILFGSLWLIAYAGAWFVKWVLTWPFIGYDMFENVKNQLLLRSSAVENSRWPAVTMNFNQLPLVVINLFLVVLLILAILRFNRRGIKPALLYLSIAAMPLIWFYATANHSLYHFWYTYRILAITVSGVFLAFISLGSWNRPLSEAKETHNAGTDPAAKDSFSFRKG